jgi:hypothetical protein
MGPLVPTASAAAGAVGSHGPGFATTATGGFVSSPVLNRGEACGELVSSSTRFKPAFSVPLFQAEVTIEANDSSIARRGHDRERRVNRGTKWDRCMNFSFKS